MKNTSRSSSIDINYGLFSLYFHSISITTNVKLHLLCILLEYIPILISTFSSAKRFSEFLRLANSDKTYEEFESRFHPYSLLNNKPKSIQIFFFSFVVGICVFLLAIYIILTIFNFRTLEKNKLIIFLRNVYDFVLFRYFSGYFIYSFVKLCVILYFEETKASKAVCIVIFCVFILYLISTLYFIMIHSTSFHINNKDICTAPFEYPFDVFFSRQYDICGLIIKILEAFEFSLFQRYANGNMKIFFIQGCLIIIQYLFLCYQILCLVFNEPYSTGIVINKPLNFLRHVIVFYNCFYMIYVLLIDKDNSNNFLKVSANILCLFIGISITLYFFQAIEEKIQYSPKVTVSQLTFLLTHRIKSSQIILKHNLKFFNKNSIASRNESYVDCLHQSFRKLFENIAIGAYTTQDIFYSKLFTLFLYHIQNKSYKFYELLNGLVTDKSFEYKNQYFYAYKICVKYLETNEDNSCHNECVEIFKSVKISTKFQQVLMNIKDLIEKSEELQYPSFFFSISETLHDLKKKLKLELLGKHYVLYNEKEKKFQNIEKYNNIILWYLYEKLTGYSLSETNKINIEMFEDFLFYHYNEDKFMILTQERLNKDKEIFSIIKCGNELVRSKKKETLLDIIPEEYVKDGYMTFVSAIKNCEDFQKEGSFKYVIKSIEKDGYLDYFDFNFKISNQLVDNKGFIFGEHKSIFKSRILVFRRVQDNLCLINFSYSCSKIFNFTPDDLDLIYHSFPFLMLQKNFIFSSIKCVEEPKKEYEFIFRPKEFQKNLQQVLEKNNMTETPLKKIISNNSKTNEIFLTTGNAKFLLKKIISVSTNTGVQDEVFLVTEVSHLETKKKFTEVIEKRHLETDYLENNIISTGSMSSVSMDSRVNKGKNQKGNFIRSSNENLKCLFFTQKEEKIFSKEIRKYSIIYNLTILLSIGSIVIFNIFLAIQSVNTSGLVKVDLLYYELKGMRVQLEHTFLSVISNICLAKKGEENCLNYYDVFSQEMVDTGKISPEFNIGNLVISELPYKLDSLKEIFDRVSEDMFNYGNQDYIDLLNTDMRFFSLSYNELTDKLESFPRIINFQDGLGEFMNSVMVLVNYEKSYQTIPIYIITNNKDTIDFSNLYKQSISFEQLNIYLILVNYIFFYHIMFEGDYMLLEETERLISANRTCSNIFIVITLSLILLNFSFTGFCLKQFRMVIKLIILRMKKLMRNKNLVKFLKEKFLNLITLSQLYYSSPLDLFDNLEKNEKDFKRFIKNELAKLSSKTPSPLGNERELNTLSEHNLEIFEVTVKYIIRVAVYYFGFLVFAGGYGIYLQNEMTHFVALDDFMYYFPAHEMDMYSSLVVPQIASRLNMTGEDVGELQGNEDVSDYDYGDGYTNGLIRLARDNLDNLTKLHKSSGFKNFSKYFPEYNCESIFNNLDDPIISKVELNYQVKNSTKALIELCKYYRTTLQENFGFFYNDYFFRTQKLLNYLDERSYLFLYKYIHQKELYEMISLSLLIMRPISYYLTNRYLNPGVRAGLYHFKEVVIVYLVCNIFFSFSLFFLIKYSVIEKLNKKMDNLFFLNSVLWV